MKLFPIQSFKSPSFHWLHYSHQPLGQCRKAHFGLIFFCTNNKCSFHCLHRKLWYRCTYMLLSEVFGGAPEPWVIASHVARSETVAPLLPLFQASLASVLSVCTHQSFSINQKHSQTLHNWRRQINSRRLTGGIWIFSTPPNPLPHGIVVCQWVGWGGRGALNH